jgi:ribonuclease P protein component
VIDRLRQRADFLAAAQGPRAPSAAFVVQSRAREDARAARVGFTVSKKVGNAPERSRVKRRLRALVAAVDGSLLRQGRDYVLVGRRVALTRDFHSMLDDLRAALKRLDRRPAANGRQPPSDTPRASRAAADTAPSTTESTSASRSNGETESR